MSSTPILLPPTSVAPTPGRPTSAPPSSAPTSPSPTSNGASPSLSTSPSGTAQTATTTSNIGSSSISTTSSLPATTPQLTTPDGSVATLTSTTFVVATQAPTSQNNPSNPNSFFSNKGAVAGVFAVVGVIAVALVIVFIINGIRRRRAQKFDRDVAEAAAEAAASSRSPFDDYGYANTGGNGGGPGGGVGYGYSDNSHGTYQLPPLSPQNAPYGMTEMSQYDPYVAGAAPLAAAAVGRSRSRKDSDLRAPGLAGVGAGTLAREPTKRAPYHAFAGPAPQSYDIQGDVGRYGSRRSNHDILEAAGLGGVGAAAAFANTTAATTNNNGPGGAYVTRKPSDTTQNTQFNGRSKFGSGSSGGHHPATLQPAYPVDSYYPQRNDSLSPDPFAGYPIATAPSSQGYPNPHDATPGPLPPISGHQSDHVEDYVDTGSPTALRSNEQRMSYQDNTDYSQGHRVLRVANE